VWTPSHSGIEGNEKADAEAKNSLEREVDTREPLSKIDLLHFVDQKLKKNAERNSHRDEQKTTSRCI
jgi:ribonuclease HI